MKRFLPIFCLLVVISLLWGCSYKTIPAPEPTPELIIITDNSAPADAATPDTLLSYENAKHGFAFTYPGTWSLTETPGNGVSKNATISLERLNTQLVIEYGFLSEIQGLTAISLPPGEWVELASVSFFDKDLPTNEIVQDGKIKLAAFPELGQVFLVQDLFFRLIVQPTGAAVQAEIDFDDTFMAEIDGIIESFSFFERSSPFAEAHPDWNIFLSMDFGLLLRYPSEWQLEEIDWETVPGLTEKALSLTKGKAQLLVGYHFKNENVPHTANFLGGLLVDEGSVPILGKEIPILVLQYEGKEKAVIYNSLEGFESGELVFNIRLQDTTTGAGVDLIEVKDADQTEAAEILASLRQFTPALTPPEESMISQGKQFFLTFGSCFDLDQGMQKAENDPTCDFVLKRVTGSNQKISLTPLNQAVFDFKTKFEEPPTSSVCAATETMTTTTRTDLVLDKTALYCLQTNVGRFGWLGLYAMTDDGVGFDWQITSTIGALHTAAWNSSGERDAAVTIRDMTIPDGTEMKPGQVFTKTWQLLNKGTSTWTTDYAIRFETGERMGAPYEAALLSQVPPGGAVNISIEMTAPMEPGEYTSHWVMRNASGNRFGMGTDGSKTFWVMIVVEE